jgi:hypothetical protein
MTDVEEMIPEGLEVLKVLDLILHQPLILHAQSTIID